VAQAKAAIYRPRGISFLEFRQIIRTKPNLPNSLYEVFETSLIGC
jgi:hypothetical protein